MGGNKMNEFLMTEGEIKDQIEFEDRCGVNTLLQQLVCAEQKGIEVNVYKVVDEKGNQIDCRVEAIK
jgi:hypothetical protein